GTGERAGAPAPEAGNGASGENPRQRSHRKEVSRAVERNVAEIEQPVSEREDQRAEEARTEEIFSEGDAALAQHADAIGNAIAVAAHERHPQRVLHRAADVFSEAERVAAGRPIRAIEIDGLG